MPTGKCYLVVSPEYYDIIPVCADGSGPKEYGSDVLYVRARSARRAKVLAVRAWRRIKARYLRDAENPFTGVRCERVNINGDADHFDTGEYQSGAFGYL